MVAGTYRRMFHRWEILRGWLPAILFAAIAVAILVSFFNYVIGRGMPDDSFSIPLGSLSIPLSIALSLSLGNAILLLALWMTVFENTAYIMAGPDRKVRRILYPVRMIKSAGLVLAPFTIVLFTPYIVMSGWFINFIAGIPPLTPSAANFYSWSFGVSRTDAYLRFVASQLSAALASTVVVGIQIWRVKGTRNLMMLLRRKR